ncbi:MAG TPA: porin [Thermoguttaceae bacterium]|nr:porin [Thermoguttaceae bacterium]
MKAVKLLLGVAFLGACVVGASAQNPSQPTLASPELSDYYYLTQAEPSEDVPADAPLPPEIAEEEPFYGGGCQEECGGCSAKGGLLCGCPTDKPWTLPQPCFLKQRGITMGGWLQQGITFNEHSPPSGFNATVGTNDWDSEYQMNQLWMYFVRPVQRGHGLDIGGRVDMIYGTDWRFGINQGLEDRINSLGNSYGLVIPQAYVEIALNRWSVKLGHFAGILDYEAVPAVANPFYSHSLCYAFTVPQLVTGVLADYQASDRLSFQGGVHRGWMKFEDNNDRMDVMAGFKLNSSDKRTSLAYAISSGPQDAAGDNDRFVHSLVLQRQVTDRLKYILVQNLGSENNSGPQGQDAEWYGINQYFLYAINPCWSANLRFEWLRDDDGVIVHGPPAAAGIRAWPGEGYAGDFYEVTAGLSWRPSANLVVRPECRWDWYDGQASSGALALPFNDGASDSQFTFGVDAILTY